MEITRIKEKKSLHTFKDSTLSKLRKGIVGLAGNAFYFLSVSLSIIVKAVAARKEYLFMQELTCFQRQPYP